MVPISATLQRAADKAKLANNSMVGPGNKTKFNT